VTNEPGRAACNGDDREYVATERVGVIVWQLAHGDTLTTAQVAVLAALSYSGAHKMMQKLSRSIPILCFDGEWMPAVMAEVLYVDDLSASDKIPA